MKQAKSGSHNVTAQRYFANDIIQVIFLFVKHFEVILLLRR